MTHNYFYLPECGDGFCSVLQLQAGRPKVIEKESQSQEDVGTSGELLR